MPHKCGGDARLPLWRGSQRLGPVTSLGAPGRPTGAAFKLQHVPGAELYDNVPAVSADIGGTTGQVDGAQNRQGASPSDHQRCAAGVSNLKQALQGSIALVLCPRPLNPMATILNPDDRSALATASASCRPFVSPCVQKPPSRLSAHSILPVNLRRPGPKTGGWPTRRTVHQRNLRKAAWCPTVPPDRLWQNLVKRPSVIRPTCPPVEGRAAERRQPPSRGTRQARWRSSSRGR